MQTVDSVRVKLAKDTFNIYSYRIPKYEIPAIMNLWGPESATVLDDKVEPLELNSIDEEIHRIHQKYGIGLVQKTYGNDYHGALEKAIEEYTIEKRDTDGENPVKSEDGASTEARL